MGSIPGGIRRTLLSAVTEILVVEILFNYIKFGGYVFLNGVLPYIYGIYFILPQS